MKRWILGASASALLSVGAAGRANAAPTGAEGAPPGVAVEAGAPPDDRLGPPDAPDVRAEPPNLVHAYAAYGATARSVGAEAYGLASGAAGQRGLLGGGFSVWASPVDRVTLIADGQRNAYGNFSPSLAVVARLLGTREAGWSLGALGKFKVDGFASGPARDEIEAEVELGLLLSFARRRWHIDLNAIGGQGTGDDGEIDLEGRLRVGRDLGRWARVGIDGEVRARLAGPRYLPNGRTWDFSAGPQLLVGASRLFGALTAGPTTAGVLSDRLGASAVVTVGGSTF